MLQRRIRIGEVVMGQALPWSVYTDSGLLLLARGERVRSARQLQRLLTSGFCLVEPTPTCRQPPMSALQYVLHAYYRMQQLFQAPEQHPHFPGEVWEVAQLIEQGYRRAPEVFIAAVLLQRGGNYTLHHSVNAACVAAALLRELHPRDPANRLRLAAALTMNIGVLDLLEKLSHQPDPLTPSQQARIEHHPFDSVVRLRKLGVEDEAWLRMVQQHHEALDGSGYPQRLHGRQIEPAALLIGLADEFCARVSERSFWRADSAKRALDDIQQSCEHRYGVVLLGALRRALGGYPIGTVVQLASGEIGVVSGCGAVDDAPIVHALLTADGLRLALPICYDTREPAHAIAEALSIAELGITLDMEAIWGDEARDFQREPCPDE